MLEVTVGSERSRWIVKRRLPAELMKHDNPHSLTCDRLSISTCIVKLSRPLYTHICKDAHEQPDKATLPQRTGISTRSALPAAIPAVSLRAAPPGSRGPFERRLPGTVSTRAACRLALHPATPAGVPAHGWIPATPWKPRKVSTCCCVRQ